MPLMMDIYAVADKYDPQEYNPNKEISVSEPPLLKSGEENPDSEQ